MAVAEGLLPALSKGHLPEPRVGAVSPWLPGTSPTGPTQQLLHLCSAHWALQKVTSSGLSCPHHDCQSPLPCYEAAQPPTTCSHGPPELSPPHPVLCQAQHTSAFCTPMDSTPKMWSVFQNPCPSFLCKPHAQPSSWKAPTPFFTCSTPQGQRGH